MKETLSCIQKSFPAYSGFIVGCWSSIVQTSPVSLENKKNPETKGKIQALSFPTINSIY